MKKSPKISFCISTYKRPEYIKKLIETIFKQNYKNVEIVICEDKSDNTSENVIKAFEDKRIKYIFNKKHQGMVKSFNNAFKASSGDFITILADDDPPTKDMIKTFLKYHQKYPKAKAFWGGSFVNITSKKIEKINHLKLGLNSLVNTKSKYGSSYVLKSKDFFQSFFTQSIFPHYLWNASLISREVITSIKGVPEYNSAHFSDYGYLLNAASKTDFVIINKELAVFSLHELNYGRGKDTLLEYKRGVIGFNKIAFKFAKKYNCIDSYYKFMSDYIIMFLVNRLEHYRIYKYPIKTNELLNVYKDLSKNLPFLKTREEELVKKLNLYSKSPYVYNFVNFAKRKYGDLKQYKFTYI